jgi:hypothetical protein
MVAPKFLRLVLFSCWVCHSSDPLAGSGSLGGGSGGGGMESTIVGVVYVDCRRKAYVGLVTRYVALPKSCRRNYDLMDK